MARVSQIASCLSLLAALCCADTIVPHEAYGQGPRLITAAVEDEPQAATMEDGTEVDTELPALTFPDDSAKPVIQAKPADEPSSAPASAAPAGDGLEEGTLDTGGLEEPALLPDAAEEAMPADGMPAVQGPVQSGEALDEPSDPKSVDESPAADAMPEQQAAEPDAEQPAAPDSAGEENEASDDEPDAPTAAPELVLPPLSQSLISLRDRTRRVLATYQQAAISTRLHSATEVLNYCLPYGCRTEIGYFARTETRMNAITCLCWNYPCAGHVLLKTGHGEFSPRVGYGVQAYPGQFLATLAFSRVPSAYPVRVGQDVRDVAGIVEFEQLTCQRGSDLSLKLVGLSYYVEPDSAWKNIAGEEWDVQRLIQEELSKPILAAPAGGLLRLTGLAYADAQRERDGLPLTGQYARARKFLDEFHVFAFSLQNGDGSWHPLLFAARGTSNDAAGTLRATGLVLRWLAISLPAEELEGPRMVRAVDYVTSALGNRRWDLSQATSRDFEGVTTALHALALYDGRVFKPRDTAEPAPAAAPTQSAAVPPQAATPAQRLTRGSSAGRAGGRSR